MATAQVAWPRGRPPSGPSPLELAPPTRNFRLCLLSLVAAAFAMRIGIRFVAGTEDYWTSGYRMYADLAHSLLTRGIYGFSWGGETAFRVPLYPLLIAATGGPAGSPWPFLVVQAGISAGLVAVTGLLGHRLFGPLPGLVAAAWCTVYPYYAWHDTALQEIGLFKFLVALATLLLLVLAERRKLWLAAAAGLVLALALLTRSAVMPFALLALAWLLVPDGRGTGLRVRVASAAVCGLVLLAALSPWLSYQARVAGAPGLGTENGISLYRGSSPLLFTHFPRSKVDDDLLVIHRAMPPALRAELDRLPVHGAAQSAFYASLARRQIASDPVFFARRAVRKLAIAFGPRIAPRRGLAEELVYSLSWVPLLLLAPIGVWRDRRNWRRNLLFAAHIGAFCAVTAFVWAQTSHRSYLDVYFMVFAAPVLVALAPAWLRRRAEALLEGAGPATPGPTGLRPG